MLRISPLGCYCDLLVLFSYVTLGTCHPGWLALAAWILPPRLSPEVDSICTHARSFSRGVEMTLVVDGEHSNHSLVRSSFLLLQYPT
jgi:hypothetical protein